MRRAALLLSVFCCLVSFAQRKDTPYPILKQLKEKDLQADITPKSNRKGLWGYVNEKDHFVIKAVFDAAEPFRTDKGTRMKTLAKVFVNGKEGYLQRDALYLIPPIYDSLSGLEDGVIYFMLDGKKGFLDVDGDVIANDLDELVPFSDRDYAWICRNGLWGAIGRAGDTRISPVFTEEPEALDPNTWLVKVHKKQGLLQAKDLSFILPAKYDDIVLDRQYALLYAGQDGAYAVFRKDGTKLTDFILQKPPVFVNNVMKFFNDGKPWLLFSDGRCLGLGDYERSLRTSQSRYAADSVMPGSVKTSLTSRNEGLKDRPWRLSASSAEGIRFIHSDWKLEEDEDQNWYVRTVPLGRVELDKFGELAGRSGAIYGTRLKDLTVSLDGNGMQNIGNALSILFKTINTSRITVFDRKRGTDLFHGWKQISFSVYGGIWTGEYRLFAINMFIDCYDQSYFVQRWYVLLDSDGRIVSRWNEDGDVNNPEHPVNRDSFNLLPADGNGFFVVEDWGDTSEFFNRVYKTTLRTSDGSVLGSYLNEFLPYAVAVGRNGFRLFGVGPYGDALEGGNSLGADDSCWFSRDGDVTGTEIPYFLKGWTKENGLYSYGDCFIAMTTVTEGEEIVVGTCPMGAADIYMPAIKYREDPWADGILIAVSYNYFHPNEWMVFAKEPSTAITLCSELSGPVFEPNQFKIVSSFPDEAGFYLYSYSRYDTTRYGYLGNGKLTQPVFDKANPFIDGEAEVVILGEKKTFTLRDLSRYLSK